MIDSCSITYCHILFYSKSSSWSEHFASSTVILGNNQNHSCCEEVGLGVGVQQYPEMQKVADAADISVLFFFQLVLIFRSFLGHFLVLIFCGKILLCAI